MAALTALAIGGLLLGGAGLAMQYTGQQSAMKAQEQDQALQQQQEQQRQQQMELDATRRNREMVRQSIAARSQALAATTAGGANTSSAVSGAYGGISGRTNVNELGVNQNLQIGQTMFAIGAERSQVNMQFTKAQGEAQMGGSLVGFGSMMLNNSDKIGKIGSFFGGQTGSGASGFGSFFSGSGSNPFNSDGSRNTMAYGS